MLCYVCQNDFMFWRRAIIVSCINAVTRPYLNTFALYESRCKQCKLSQEDLGSVYEDTSLWWNVLWWQVGVSQSNVSTFCFSTFWDASSDFYPPLLCLAWDVSCHKLRRKKILVTRLLSSVHVTSKSEIYRFYYIFPNYNLNMFHQSKIYHHLNSPRIFPRVLQHISVDSEWWWWDYP